MNFLAHGHRWLDRPDRLAGTALPDWLSLLAPASRLRGRALGLPEREDRSAEAAPSAPAPPRRSPYLHQGSMNAIRNLRYLAGGPTL